MGKLEGVVIYFLQREDKRIKIGTTGKYHQRLSALVAKYGALNLLGYADGGHSEEHALHVRFANYNTGEDGREWFYPADELMTYIDTCTSKPNPQEIEAILKATRRKIIPVKQATYRRVQDYSNGLGASSMSEALDFVFSQFGIGEKPYLDGAKVRDQFLSRKQTS